MFETFLIKPVFNLLVTIYALLPGHNFGLAIIVFTILARILMWPVLKKQLHHTKKIKALQPKLKQIKKETKGDRQKFALASMALYKKHEVNPYASIGYLLLQLPILIALYTGVNRIANNPQVIVNDAYGPVLELEGVQEIKKDITTFDPTLFGTIDLTRQATEDGQVYNGALLIALLGALIQFASARQLMLSGSERKSLRSVLKQQSDKGEIDQSELNEAASQVTMYVIPVFVFVISLNLVAALPFYWFVNGLIGYFQQARVLKTDQEEMAIEVEDDDEVETTPKKLNAKQKRLAMKAGRNAQTKTKKKGR